MRRATLISSVLAVSAVLSGAVHAQSPIPAAEMAKLFASDRSAYFARYGDKPIVITGDIGDVTPGYGSGAGTLTLDGMTTDHGGLDVSIREGVSFKDLKPGQKIAVRCTLKTTGSARFPEDCAIVAVAAGRLPWPPFFEAGKVVEARELARAFSADKAAALARFGGKAVVITGKIGVVNTGGLAGKYLLLDGLGPLDPDAFLLNLSSDTPMSDLKVGQKVTMTCVVAIERDKAEACRIGVPPELPPGSKR